VPRRGAGVRAARDNLVALNDLPAISWNRLAIEMKANIRLGLAAGECVRGGRESVRPVCDAV
jgi:hypothetical protein